MFGFASTTRVTPAVLSINSLIKSAYALVVAALSLMGCAEALGGAIKAYPGPERPASDVAVIECGHSLAMVAIDENKSFSGSPDRCRFSLLPGKHRLRVRIQSDPHYQYSYIGGFQQQGGQVVEHELVAGKSYGLHAVEDQKSRGLWTISMSDPATNKLVPLKQLRPQ